MCYARICFQGVIDKIEEQTSNQDGLHGGVKAYEYTVSGYIHIMDSLPGEIILQIV